MLLYIFRFGLHIPNTDSIMKLVSIDVGLRNLAVCVMEGTSRSDVKILHWEVIDVMAESVGLSKPTCYKCKKAANWVNNGKYSCKPHTSILIVTGKQIGRAHV